MPAEGEIWVVTKVEVSGGRLRVFERLLRFEGGVVVYVGETCVR